MPEAPGHGDPLSCIAHAVRICPQAVILFVVALELPPGVADQSLSPSSRPAHWRNSSARLLYAAGGSMSCARARRR